MHRLRGIDSMFLSLESDTNLFHVGAVAVLDPSTAPPGSPPPHEALRRVVASRLDRLGPLRRRPVGVPGGLDHPRWVEDAPDVERHVRRGALPTPGGERELSDYTADVLARPLERGRPLWEIHVVEGLEAGLVAGVAKIHHSAIDGIGGTEVTGELMDLEPVVDDRPPDGGRPREPIPNPLTLIGGALSQAGRRLGPAGRLATRLSTDAFVLRSRNRHLDAAPPPSPFASPRTGLSSRIGPERTVGLTRVERADVDALRQATGVTINDIVLFLVSSAVRTFLDDRGELPEQSLVAFVPKSIRSAADTLDTGVNRLTGMLVSLRTEIDDPVERLLAIAQSARSAKEQARVIGEDLFAELAELVPPILLGPAGRLARALGFTTRWPPFSVVVSSFPGPPCPLYCAGAEMVAYHPFGPIVDGAALNITAMSYRDHIGFGLLACRDAVDDIGPLSSALSDAMSEVNKALGRGRARRTGTPGST